MVQQVVVDSCGPSTRVRLIGVNVVSTGVTFVPSHFHTSVKQTQENVDVEITEVLFSYSCITLPFTRLTEPLQEAKEVESVDFCISLAVIQYSVLTKQSIVNVYVDTSTVFVKH